MEYKVIFRPLTEMSNHFVRRQNPHVNSAEDFKEVVINAVNENHAMHIFMTMVQHSGIKVAQYRIEPFYQKNDTNQ